MADWSINFNKNNTMSYIKLHGVRDMKGTKGNPQNIYISCITIRNTNFLSFKRSPSHPQTFTIKFDPRIWTFLLNFL